MKPALEAARRLAVIRKDLETGGLEGEELRQDRGLQVLAWIGSSGAKDLLDRLAPGAASRLTPEAEKALRRLGAAPPGPSR